MQNIKQFVKERQEIKSLQTCESHFFTFPTKICGVSVIIFALQKTVQVDTRFYPDTGPIHLFILYTVTNQLSEPSTSIVAIYACSRQSHLAFQCVGYFGTTATVYI